MITDEKIPPVFSNSNIAIRLHSDSMRTFYGNPYSSQTAYNLLEELKQIEYTEETFYVNSTYRNISVMGRNGLAVNIPYVSSYNTQGFIIRKIIKLKGHSLASAMDALQSITQLDSLELIEVKKVLSGTDRRSFIFTSIMIDYLITLDDLKCKGNTLYHYQTDLMISLNDTITIDAHPYSSRFLGIGTFGITNDYTNQQELNLKIKYVNHDINASPVYLNVFGKVFTVFPQRDAPARKLYSGKSGNIIFEDYLIFFYSSRNDTEVLSGNGVSAVKMSLAEARENIGLYDTYQEAQNYGNVELTRKEELSALNHKLEILKQSTAIEKSRLDKEDLIRKEKLLEKEHALEMLKKETAELKQDLELASQKLNIQVLENKQKQTLLDTKLQDLDNEKRILEIKRKDQDDRIDREKKEFEEKLKLLRDEHDHRLKQESMYWRDFYEKRSYERKDTSEVVKFIPGILIGVIGIATAVIKMSPNKA